VGIEPTLRGTRV